MKTDELQNTIEHLQEIRKDQMTRRVRNTSSVISLLKIIAEMLISIEYKLIAEIIISIEEYKLNKK